MFIVANPELFHAEPEFGMGYHIGEVANGARSKSVVVAGLIAFHRREIVDGVLLERVGRLLDGWQNELTPESLASILDAPIRPMVPCNDYQAIVDEFDFSEEMKERMALKTERKGTVHGSPPFAFVATPRQIFVRFTAFPLDPRIGPGGEVRSGTYMTSQGDAAVVPSGFAAVGRYALPLNYPAIYQREIVSDPSGRYLAGAVMSAFGFGGGGVEIQCQTTLPPGSAGPVGIIQLV